MEIKSLLLRYWAPFQSIIVGLATIVCGVLLAQTTWLFLSPAEEIKAARITSASSIAQSQGTNWSKLARDISVREFFGEEVEQEKAPTQEVVEAPETKLAFTLQAVIAEGEGQGFAVIAQRSGVGKVFGVDDDLFGQASLSAVYGDRVIIDRRGQLETLRYEQIKSLVVLQAAEREDPAGSLKEAIDKANKAASEDGDIRAPVQDVVSYVTQKVNENPEAFMREMGLEPTDSGYQVTRRARQLQMVGLRPGDVVTSVNDTPVGNISSDQVLLSQVLQSGGEVKIQIKRGSRSFTIYQSIPTF